MSDIKTKYPPNKKYSQEEPQVREKKLDKVVQGKVITKSKSPIKKILGRFLSDDVEDIKGYLIDDVVIPAVKDTVYDVITGGSSMVMYGNTSGRSRGGKKGSITNYRNISEGKTTKRVSSYSSPRSFSFDDIIVETRGEAEDLLSSLADCIDEYEAASVADLYDLVGKTGSFTDNKWGWTSIQGAKVRRVKEGYLLDLPKVELLD